MCVVCVVLCVLCVCCVCEWVVWCVVLREMHGFKDQTIEVFVKFYNTQLRCDTLFAFVGCCDAIPSHFTGFLGSK